LTLKFLELQRNPFHRQQNKYVILDIDQTLAYTFQDEDHARLSKAIEKSNYDVSDIVYKISEVRGRKSRLFVYGVKRPYLDVFLQFCHLYYKGVIIWSAGTDYYVEKMVAELFKNLPKPVMVYKLSDCESKDGSLFKPIEKLFEESKLAGMDYTNSLVIDDNAFTFSDNVDNAIHIPAYVVKPKMTSISEPDSALLQLIWWMLKPEVLCSDDIQDLEKPSFHS